MCRDSCVELFLEPKPGRGYFNFEFNCAGTLMACHVEDPTRAGRRFQKIRPGRGRTWVAGGCCLVDAGRDTG